MKITPTGIRVDNAELLFWEMARRLKNEFRYTGENGVKETDWFNYQGYSWCATADIEAEFKTEFTDHLTPPITVYTYISLIIKKIECTDIEGNLIPVEFYDEDGEEMGDDELKEMIVELFT